MKDLNLVHGYADGELTANERAHVESLLQSSPQAQAEFEAIKNLKSFLAAQPSKPVEPALWKSCAKRLDEIDRAKRTEGFITRYAWALSLLLFVVIMGGGYLRRIHGSSVGTGEVAAYASSLVPISGPKPRQAEQLNTWINDQTGQRPKITLDPSRILGVAIADQGDRRIVSVRFTDQSGELALMVIPGVTAVDGVQPMGNGMFACKIDKMNGVTWGDGDCAVVLIGNRDYEYLRTVALALYR